jgi:lipoate-protein ligase A
MALDEAIAVYVRKGASPPTLRLYGWKLPSVSLGSFQKITDIDAEYCSDKNIPVVRRPTGGRGILHGDELTYGFSARSEGEFSGGLLETYRKLSGAFYEALRLTGIHAAIKTERETGRNLTRSPLCFESTSYGELSFNNIKLIGSAQKRWKDGFLQQGSIPYSIDYEKLEAVFGNNGQGKKLAGLKELLPIFEPQKFRESVKSSFEKIFGVNLVCSLPSLQELKLADSLSLEKYLNPGWTEEAVRKSSNCRRCCNSNEIRMQTSQG